jgi:diguanylate cyclase (GGDEF)-like protein
MRAASSPPGTPASAALPIALATSLLVFGLALFGILTRPVGYLSALWPANAVLLGMMVRHPRWTRWPGWLGALAGYLAADLLTGGGLLQTLWLTAGNLSGVVVGVLLFRYVAPGAAQLRQPASVLHLFLVCTAVSASSALVGSVAGPLMFGTRWTDDFVIWLCTELVNHLLILPVIFTAPTWARLRTAASAWRPAWPGWAQAGPALSVLACALAAVLIGGPGALAIPVPALLWCAITYSLFTTTGITLLVCFWQMFAAAGGAFSTTAFNFSPAHLPDVFSLRMGFALFVLGPLTAAVSHASRNEMLRRLDHAVTYDFLTQALSRGAFMQHGNGLLQQLAREGQAAAVLMFDLDHFKQVNDQHGHAVGDEVLTRFANVVRRVLRTGDLFGRMGGEEFAVILPRVKPGDAQAIAQRLREEVARESLRLPDGGLLGVTTSIGYVMADPVPEPPALEGLLSRADRALYEAKAAGRDRIAPAVA